MDQFKNGFLAQARYMRRMDGAQSPFFQHIQNAEEKRSMLFPDRRRVPGRKTKFILSIAACCGIWGTMKVAEIKRFQKRKHENKKRFDRQVAPVYQAQSIVRVSALEERRDALVNDILAHKGKDFIERLTQRYHQTDVWAPFKVRQHFMYQGTNRNPQPYRNLYLQRFLHNYDLKNL